jgi:aminoglycoside phosphotransferase (APT) family kinase protein
MAAVKMHADEVHTDAHLVRRLLAAQFPEWAALPIERVPSDGTDNALYRLGDDMVVRLPRIHWAAGGIENAHDWLPRLAPLVPVQLPVPLAKGAPGEGFAWSWSVYRWLEGEHPTAGDGDAVLAREIARFVRALHAVDLRGGPPAARGRSLAGRDEPTRDALAALRGKIDTDAAEAAWEAALRAPDYTGPAVWVHGDLMPGNLLLADGRLTAVIDFGGVGVGDPACDLMIAWNLLSAGTREVFRAELDVDDAMWARGRGWALSTGLIALPYYERTNPGLAANARYRIREVLADG